MDGRLRNMTALYIVEGERVLLLHRIGSRVVGNSYTGTAGGHFEPEELNDPRACVLRELQEEMGLTEDALREMTMRYACMRMKNREIRQNYYFFAGLKDPGQKLESNEGTLTWTAFRDLGKYPMPHTARVVLEHYVKEGCHTAGVYGCLTTPEGAIFTPLREFGD